MSCLTKLQQEQLKALAENIAEGSILGTCEFMTVFECWLVEQAAKLGIEIDTDDAGDFLATALSDLEIHECENCNWYLHASDFGESGVCADCEAEENE